MGYLLLGALWAAWTAVFVLTGWAEGWGGAAGAGFVLGAVCSPLAALLWALGETLWGECRPPQRPP